MKPFSMQAHPGGFQGGKQGTAPLIAGLGGGQPPMIGRFWWRRPLSGHEVEWRYYGGGEKPVQVLRWWERFWQRQIFMILTPNNYNEESRHCDQSRAAGKCQRRDGEKWGG